MSLFSHLLNGGDHVKHWDTKGRNIVTVKNSHSTDKAERLALRNVYKHSNKFLKGNGNLNVNPLLFISSLNYVRHV